MTRMAWAFVTLALGTPMIFGAVMLWWSFQPVPLTIPWSREWPIDDWGREQRYWRPGAMLWIEREVCWRSATARVTIIRRYTGRDRLWLLPEQRTAAGPLGCHKRAFPHVVPAGLLAGAYTIDTAFEVQMNPLRTVMVLAPPVRLEIAPPGVTQRLD